MKRAERSGKGGNGDWEEADVGGERAELHLEAGNGHWEDGDEHLKVGHGHVGTVSGQVGAGEGDGVAMSHGVEALIDPRDPKWRARMLPCVRPHLLLAFLLRCGLFRSAECLE